MQKKISPGLVKAVSTAASKVFPDPQQFYDFLQDNYNVESRLDLTYREALEVMDTLTKMQGRPSYRRYYGTGNRNGIRRLTEAQAHKIGALERLLGWELNPARLSGFIEKQTGKKAVVQSLMKHEASKVIVGLQRILTGGDKSLYKLLNDMRPGDPDTPVGMAVIKTVRKRLNAAKCG